jgi:hypothetical protein
MKRTKWEILKEREAKAWAAWKAIDQELASLGRTIFKDGDSSCATCGAPLPTEAAFAAHYLVDDERYLNIGNCPTRYNNNWLMPRLTVELEWEAHQLNETKDKLQAKGTPITLEQFLRTSNGGYYHF